MMHYIGVHYIVRQTCCVLGSSVARMHSTVDVGVLKSKYAGLVLGCKGAVLGRNKVCTGSPAVGRSWQRIQGCLSLQLPDPDQKCRWAHPGSHSIQGRRARPRPALLGRRSVAAPPLPAASRWGQDRDPMPSRARAQRPPESSSGVGVAVGGVRPCVGGEMGRAGRRHAADARAPAAPGRAGACAGSRVAGGELGARARLAAAGGL